MTSNLRERALPLLGLAKQNLVDYGSLSTIGFIWSPDDTLRLVNLVFSSYEEKSIIKQAFKDLCLDSHATVIGIVAESWIKVQDSNDFVAHSSVKDMPGRTECILLELRSAGSHFSMIQNFSRNGDEIIFGELDELDGVVVSEWTEGIWTETIH